MRQENIVCFCDWVDHSMSSTSMHKYFANGRIRQYIKEINQELDEKADSMKWKEHVYCESVNLDETASLAVSINICEKDFCFYYNTHPWKSVLRQGPVSAMWTEVSKKYVQDIRYFCPQDNVVLIKHSGNSWEWRKITLHWEKKLSAWYEKVHGQGCF